MESFAKYHGLGNDFVVLDRRASNLDIDAALARRLCDRHFGIGADGVLVILPAPGFAGRMVVHNADGSIAEMCGNGLRCVARHLAERGPRTDRLEVMTGAGARACELGWLEGHVSSVTLSMGPAMLEASNLPQGPFVKQTLGEAYGTLAGTAVSMGNPHLVLFVDASRAGELGPKLERHRLFPERTNVEFVQPRADGGLDVTVWERGVGLTLACGTGACAAVVVAALEGRVPWGEWVPVTLPGGLLSINASEDRSEVLLRGPVEHVFEGAFT